MDGLNLLTFIIENICFFLSHDPTRICVRILLCQMDPNPHEKDANPQLQKL
jgi:hypothetical protein